MPNQEQIEKTIAVAEIVIDESNNVLWNRPYIFRRMHGVGNSWVENHHVYLVLQAAVTYGQYGGALIEYVVRDLGDNRMP